MVSYLLTLLGVTLPVALSAGAIYRMGRLFELRRPWRMTLAVACVFGSGLVSYATVLNANAPAAALLIGACASLFHAAITHYRSRAMWWLILAGFSASLAGVIDLGAMIFLLLLSLVILGFSWQRRARMCGIGWYALGAVPPLVLHVVLMMPGSLIPGFVRHPQSHPATPPSVLLPSVIEEDEELQSDARPGAVSVTIVRLVDGLLGPHGLIVHFPIVILGVGGIGAVFMRNWPRATKALAAACLASAALIVLTYSIADVDWYQPMFCARWFIVFTPMLVYWCGPFLRRPHTPGTWATAATLLAISILISLLGATAPIVAARPGQYTAWAAAKQLFRPATLKPQRPRTTTTSPTTTPTTHRTTSMPAP
jgi:hypothetical protein